MEGDEIMTNTVRPSERSHLLLIDDASSRQCNSDYDSSCHKSLGCRVKSITDGQYVSKIDSSSTTATNRSSWYIILFGQTIALSLSSANAASSILENKYQITIPTFQTGLVYFVLSLHLIYLFSREKIKHSESDRSELSRSMGNTYNEFEQSRMQQYLSIDESNLVSRIQSHHQIHTFPFTNFTLHTPWYTYLLLAVMDVEANYLALLSLQHTSLSSSMLLSSLSVLTTVLLRQLILGSAPYGRKRMFGVLLCLLGGCLWLLEEFYHGHDANSSGLDSKLQPEQKQQDVHIIYGDILALAAACIFGLNDVLAEYLLKSSDDQTHSRAEYLGMLGLFGAIFSFGVQAPILERQQLQRISAEILFGIHDSSDDDVSATLSATVDGEILMLLMFVISMLCYFYVSAMVFISMYDSTILNLSLQTCPLWAVVLTMLEQSITRTENEKGGWVAIPPAMFFISCAMISSGMFLYESHSRNEHRCVHVCDKDARSTEGA